MNAKAHNRTQGDGAMTVTAIRWGRSEDGHVYSHCGTYHIEPNHEYGEIILHYPSNDNTEVNAQLVYNYLFDVWYPWVLPRLYRLYEALTC